MKWQREPRRTQEGSMPAMTPCAHRVVSFKNYLQLFNHRLSLSTITLQNKSKVPRGFQGFVRRHACACFVCLSVRVCRELPLVNIYQLKWASFKRRSCYSHCSRWHGDIYCHSERKREAAFSRVWRSRSVKLLIKAKHWDLYLPRRSFWIHSVNIMGVYDEQKKKTRGMLAEISFPACALPAAAKRCFCFFSFSPSLTKFERLTSSCDQSAKPTTARVFYFGMNTICNSAQYLYSKSRSVHKTRCLVSSSVLSVV